MKKYILYVLLLTMCFGTFVLKAQCGGTVGGTLSTDDFDGDGICNVDDLDDDNDGVLDTDECSNPSILDGKVDGSFESLASIASSSGANSNPLATGWEHAAASCDSWINADNTGSGWAAGANNGLPNSPDGGVYISGSASYNGGESVRTVAGTVEVTTGQDYVVSFYQAYGGVVGSDVIGNQARFKVTLDGQVQYTPVMTWNGAGANSWELVTLTFTNMQNANPILEIRPDPVSLNTGFANGYISVDGVELKRVNFVNTECDDDNDGVPNVFDLDSDGDGCPDAVEAGIVAGGSVVLINGDVVNGDGTTNTTVSTANAKVQGSYGTNGLADSIETSAESGEVSYNSTYSLYGINNSLNVCVDTDNDGVGDLIDLDNDNDGIPDSMEMICSSEFLSSATSEGDGLAPSYTGTITDGTNSATLEFTMDATTNASWWTAYDDGSGWQYRWHSNTSTQLTVNENYKLTSTSGVLGNFKYGVNVPENNSGIGAQTNNAQDITFTWATGQKAIISNPTGQITNYADGAEVSSPVTLSISAQTIDNSDWNIEIQTETSKIFELDVARTIPSGTFTWESFGFNMGLCQDPDMDNDGKPNYLDTDSDGDGCFDAYEAGVTGATSSTETVGNSTNVGTNGLANSVETSTDSGVINYVSTYNKYAITDFLSVCADTDGDGVNDLIDIDDDNDGILDVIESPNCYYTEDEAKVIADVTSDLTIEAAARPFTNAYDGTDSTASYTGLSPNQNGIGLTVYEIVPTAPVAISSIDFSMYNLAFTNGAANMVKMQGYANGTWDDLDVAANHAVVNGIETFTNTLNPTKIYEKFRITGAAGVVYYARVQEIYLNVSNYNTHDNPKTSCSDDNDGDGEYNHVDVDSDGDGCFDATEANVGVTVDANGRIATTGAEVGSNGLDNDIESDDTSSATTTYTSTYDKYALSDFLNACADTDGDGINDLVDIDDDNDGVLDIIESPNCYYALDEQPLTGDRSAYAGFSVSSEMPTFAANPVSLSIDGVETTVGNTRFTNAQAIAGKEVYKIELPDALQLDGIKFNYASTYGFFNNGAVILQGSNDNSTWTDLSASVTYTINPNPDEDIFSVTQNAGLYKYYRLQGVSGTTYSNGYGELELLISSSNYNTQDYPKTNCSDDTDGDGEYNNVDVDSDNDGCFDAIEANVGVAVDANGRIATTGAEVGSNGLDDDIESDDTSSATTTYTSTYNKYALYDTLNACTDTDGDGINDLFDIDDDNDGILDVMESPNCYYTEDEAKVIADVTSDLTIEAAARPFTNAYDGTDSTASYTGLSPNQNGIGLTVYEIVPTIPVAISSIDFSMYNLAFTNGAANTVKMQGYANGAWEDLDVAANHAVVNGIETFTNTLHPTTVYEKFRITGAAGVVYYARVQEIYLNVNNFNAHDNPKTSCSDDNDGDGENNHVDVDSDGDGCFDATEANVGVTVDANGRIATTGAEVGSNGLDNDIESDDTSSATTTYTSTYNKYALSDFLNACADTDGDGINDLFDIDDDNDGILDIIESPNCYYTLDEQPLTGDRSAYAGFSVSSEMPTFAANPVSLSIDGVETTAGNTRFTNAQAIAGKEVYKIELPDALQLDGIKFNYASTYGFFNNGEVILQGSNDNSTWTDLSASVTYTINPNPDEDIFSVTQNAGLYKYYRLQGVSGTTYSNGYGELELLISSSNYNTQDYPKSSCSDDIDGDGEYNHLDVNSDGDTCFDAIEANVGVAVDANGRIATTGAEVGTNGLDDDIESDDTSSATTTYTSTYSRYAVSDFLDLCADTDGDGISDLEDLDDDNDGVLDIVESPNCYYTEDEARAITSVTSDLTIEAAGRPFTNAYDGVDTTSSYTGVANAQNAVGLAVYEITPTTPLAVNSIDFSMFNIAFGAATATFKLQGYTNGAWEDLDVAASRTVVNATETFTNTLHPTTFYEKFRIVGVTGTTTQARVKEIYININNYNGQDYPKETCSDDADGDGDYNHLDLNSDGDGCSDAFEAGATTDKTTDYKFSISQGAGNGDENGNGLADTVEDLPANPGTISYTSTYNDYALDDQLNLCIDTDGDTVPDVIDLDDDNDGIPDVLEQVDGVDVDTDGDNTVNRLDTDSDGDSCPDAFEADVTGATAATSTIASTFAEVGANGLADSVEKTAESGKINYTSTYIIATIKELSKCLDSDGDSVVDMDDLDADNDGVLDSVEGFNYGFICDPITSNFGFSGARNTIAINDEGTMFVMGNYTQPNTYTDLEGVVTPDSEARTFAFLNPDFTFQDGTNDLIAVEVTQPGTSTNVNISLSDGSFLVSKFVSGVGDPQVWKINKDGSIARWGGTTNSFINNADIHQNPYTGNIFWTHRTTNLAGTWYFYKMNVDGTPDTTSNFAPKPVTITNGGNLQQVASFNDGSPIVQLNHKLVKYNVDGTQSTDFDFSISAINEMEVTEDNKLVVAFTSPTATYGGYQGIVRFNADGSVDTTFEGITPTGTMRDMMVNPDTQETYLLTSEGIFKWKEDGTLDTDFMTIANDTSITLTSFARVFKFALQPDGKIVVIGNGGTGTFTSASGNTHGNITRFLSNGYLDDGSYNVGCSDYDDTDTTLDATTYTFGNVTYRVVTRNTDTDGIPDYLDLDSDGDACPDANESSVTSATGSVTLIDGNVVNGDGTVNTTTTTANAVVQGGYGANGFADSLETTEDGTFTGTYTYGNALDAMVSNCVCTVDPLTTGTPEVTKTGISTLDINPTNNWPTDVNNGFLVLESTNKGFVITRIADPETAIANPIEGMLVFDTTEKCLKLYKGAANGGWTGCIQRACP
ncbi:hypothetical protein UJ101_02214 [Flavobacteriaceae bacterium UJ101]|nr:hypothetical protein UJ101_02214 [Flavobacteriaceae bacterium UJ101]